MFQIVRRKDYIFGYQIRASIVFYQKTNNRKHLEWLKNIFQSGYIRDRNDDMTEYTIVGLKPVIEILKLLKPYVKLKSKHIKNAFLISRVLRGNLTIPKLVKASILVDKFQILNYSKKRTNTSKELITYLKQHKLYPRNDWFPLNINGMR